MTTDGWEQRLADRQARELREALERVFTHKIAYVNAPQVWGRSRVLDAVLELPEVQRLLDAQAAIERVEALAERFGWDTMPEPDWTGRQVSEAIRRALSDTP